MNEIDTDFCEEFDLLECLIFSLTIYPLESNKR